MPKFLGGPNEEQKEPLATYRFYLEMDGIVSAQFRECTGLNSTSEVIESRESNKDGKIMIKKVPGNLKWDDLVLKRGFTTDKQLLKWRQLVEKGDMKTGRKNGSIVMYNSEDTESARWSFTNGWPSKLTGPSLNSTSNEVAVEEITITHEGLERTT